MPTAPKTLSADGPKTVDIWRKSARRLGVDVEIARLAEEQHGLVTLAQLEELELSPGAVLERARWGRLHRVHQGVFAVGHRTWTEEERLLGAVMACGPRAVLSHRSAAVLWGMLEDDGDERIDVIAPNRRGRAPDAVRAHRDGELAAADRSSFRGIPCTTPTRTLLDVAAVVPRWELKRALGQGEVLRLVNHASARASIRRCRGRRGVARLRLALDEIHPERKRTRSDLEGLFLEMCQRAALPSPEVNVHLDVDRGSLEVDFLWRDARLIVEADSRRFHDTDSAFLKDRRREQRLQLAGWRVSHCTWEQVEHEPQQLANTIRRLLAQR